MNLLSRAITESAELNLLKETPKGYTIATPDVESSETSEYSDPDFTDSDECPEDISSIPTEDLIFSRSLILENQIPRSSARILEIQSPFDATNRERAVHRIIELNYHFQLSSDALYNAVCYFDILLSTFPFKLDSYQLIAAVCYWLSSKVDTGLKLTVDRINELIGTAFTSDSFKSMEITILNALGFQLSFPTAKMFMRRILTKSNATNDVFHVSNLLVEVALMKFQFVDVRPSIIAAAAIAVSWAGLRNLEAARMAIRESIWTERKTLGDSMRTMVAYAERFVRGKTADTGGIRALMGSMEFKFDIDSLISE
jgi:hypothetical protein